jgi:hypothetical protein
MLSMYYYIVKIKIYKDTKLRNSMENTQQEQIEADENISTILCWLPRAKRIEIDVQKELEERW